MFIQSQQLVTGSSNPGIAFSTTNSTTGTFLVAPKKRKALEYYNSSVASDLSFVDNSGFGTVVSGSGSAAAAQATTRQDIAEVIQESPNGQPFVRASTIKLLDTYQRCGQKVRLESF